MSFRSYTSPCCVTPLISLLIFLALVVTSTLFCNDSLAVQKKISKKKAVIVFSYRKGWWAVEDENRGIIEGLGTMGYIEGENIDISRIYMNTKTINKTAEQMESAALVIAQKIDEIDPDVLFIMDDDALKHLGAKLIDTPLPIVFGGVNLIVTDPDYGWVNSQERIPLADSHQLPGHNITGVLERIAIRPGFNVLNQILPDARSALFLSDNSILSRQLLRAAGDNAVLENLPIKVVKKIFTDDYEEMQKSVLEYQSKVDCIVMFLPWTFEDDDGNHIPQERVVRWLLENNKRPGIAYLDILAEGGFLCGVVVDMRQQGVHAGIMAGRILQGAAPESLPIVDPVANRVMINLARANQLGIEIPFEVLKNTDVILKTMLAYPEFKQ